MKKAIVTGSTGLLGKATSNYLSSMGIEVICLGRKKLSKSEIKNTFGKNVTYFFTYEKNSYVM